jgi:hypothetical protein
MARKYQPGCPCCDDCDWCKTAEYTREWTQESGSWDISQLGVLTTADDEAFAILTQPFPVPCHQLQATINLRSRSVTGDPTNWFDSSEFGKVYFFYADEDNHVYFKLHTISVTREATYAYTRHENWKIAIVVDGSETELKTLGRSVPMGTFWDYQPICGSVGTIGKRIGACRCGDYLWVSVYEYDNTCFSAIQPTVEVELTSEQKAALGSKVAFENGIATEQNGWCVEKTRAELKHEQRGGQCGDCGCRGCIEGTAPDSIEITFADIADKHCSECDDHNSVTYTLDKVDSTTDKMMYWDETSFAYGLNCAWVYDGLSFSSCPNLDVWEPGDQLGPPYPSTSPLRIQLRVTYFPSSVNAWAVLDIQQWVNSAYAGGGDPCWEWRTIGFAFREFERCNQENLIPGRINCRSKLNGLSLELSGYDIGSIKSACDFEGTSATLGIP